MTPELYFQPGFLPRALDSYTLLLAQQQQQKSHDALLDKLMGLQSGVVSGGLYEKVAFIVNFEK